LGKGGDEKTRAAQNVAREGGEKGGLRGSWLVLYNRVEKTDLEEAASSQNVKTKNQNKG